MIISRKKLAKAKVEKLKRGYSAYAETEEVAGLIEKELGRIELPVFVDRTQLGYWFIPEDNGTTAPNCPPDNLDSPCT
ncbi:hypothetical protein C8P63_104105 [Melghirimyces profundicolus]|uniref:Uncharacterized protein n=1 Tax=Melghirimyces profundicolus TaxID=1242148 RepID=A0A2T6C4K7_9BACL|nr:hypothetical protein [Melghirimyces profundicolus]PTX63260.1 hypothetical protein C8P63_104105 [Melghirimyces profundicolus]